MVFVQALKPSGEKASDGVKIVKDDVMLTRRGPARKGGVEIELGDKGEAWVPGILGHPYVYSEVHLKVSKGLPSAYDGTVEDEAVKELQKCLRESSAHHLEATVLKENRSSGIIPPEIEALSSESFKEWSASLTELQRLLLEGGVPYFIVMNRQGSNAVWFFEGSGGGRCVVTAAENTIKKIKETAVVHNLEVENLGEFSVGLSGFVGVDIGIGSIHQGLTLAVGAKLPLLLSPSQFLNSTSRLPSIRIYTDSSSRYDPPTHHLRLSGRVLPHTLARLFTTARSLGPFEADLSPNMGTSIFSHSLPFKTPWMDQPSDRPMQCPQRLAVTKETVHV